MASDEGNEVKQRKAEQVKLAAPVAARALALGATLVGMGFPFLKAAAESESAVRELLEQFVVELRVAM